MKPSEVILECANTSDCTDANTDKLNDSFNIMKSKNTCKVPPTDEFGGENKDSSFCNDLCNQLDSLGIRDIENDSKCDEKLQKKLPGENELILGQLERLSLSGDISTNLDESTTQFLLIDSVDDEYLSGLEHDQNEKPDTSENTDYVIRGQPQEHEDVDESQEHILVSRGPVGGVPVNQPEIYNFYGSRRPTIEVNQPVISGTYEWSRQQVDYDYERQSHEPPSKFVKPAADFSVNQTPFCGPFFGSNDVGLPQLPQGNWLVQCDTRPDLHLFTSHRNLSGGCVAVQSGQSPPTMGGFPVVSVSSHVLNQQVDNQVVIDELFQQNSPTSAELELTPDVWEEASEFFDGIFCEKTLFGEESQTSDGCCDIESTAGSASDAGYYSPSYYISSPGSAGEISTVCQSPDNLSNNSVDSDDDLALVLDICQNDLLKTPSTITSPPHVIESYKAQLMAEGNVSDRKFSFAGHRFDSSFIPIENCQNSHVQEQPCTSGHLTNTVKGPNQRILPKCTSSVYVTSHPQQQRSPVPDLPLPVGQVPLKTTTGDTAVAAERKYKEIRPKPVMQPLEQSSAQLNCTPGMITAAFYVPPPLASTSRRSEAIDDQKIAKYCRLIATLDNDKLRHRDQERDTVLHVAIVREEYLLVRALLPRLEREKLISEIINARNMQNQTPLYMAVCLNQPDTVGLLLEFGADVNVQIRRQTDTGPRFFLPIHFAASQGLEWSDALEELLKCPAIDVHALNDQGRTALHCAIDAHQKTKDNSTCKIDSLRIIYLLALYRADLGKEDGLSGKTPLHYVIEKKNLDLLAWFLGLIRHEFVGNAQHSRPAHEIINARTNSNATALTIAWSLPIHLVERVRMIKLLLASGAELSAKHDVSLRRELLKIPELSEALRANCRTNCRT